MPSPLEILHSTFKVPSDVIQRLEQLTVVRRFRRGENFDSSYELQNSVCYIIKGAARVYFVLNGKEHTVSFAFEDENLLTRPRMFQDNKNVELSVTFMDETELLTLSRSHLKTHLDGVINVRSQEALLFGMGAMMQYTQALEERLLVFQTMTAPERYRWLTKRYPKILEYATVTQIASYLGVTKETLYRIRSGKY